MVTIMNLAGLLLKNRDVILEKWVDAALEVYPAESAEIFGRQSDQFKNPVGFSIKSGLEETIDILMDNDRNITLPDEFKKAIRIRSVQDLLPSQAVDFVYRLKKIIVEIIGEDIKRNSLQGELIEFIGRLDSFILIVFDYYSRCRDDLSELKIKQAKIGHIKVIDRINRRLDVEPGADDNIEVSGNNI
jgi:hypothetical protein